MSRIPDPSELRPLPARPNLEYERKQAKRLLRACRAGDAEALARLRERGISSSVGELLLADAQLTIAREYGFTSWPRLVAYYQSWATHERAGPRWESYGVEYFEKHARDMLSSHQRRRPGIATYLATFVPRFFGLSDDEVFSVPVTEAEARHIIARGERFANWDDLVAQAPTLKPNTAEAIHATPFGQAMLAIRAHDIAALEQVVDAHPDMLAPEYRGIGASTLIGTAMLTEKRAPGPEAEAVTQWLVDRGADVRQEATRSLSMGSGLRVTAADVQFLLDRGADPTVVAPDGIPVLERLMMMGWNPAAVDLIRPLVVPRRAFWIAAGLDDVETMRSFFNPDGSLTAEAHEFRPDYVALGYQLPQRPEVPDREIMWEAFMVAGFNRRVHAMDFLLARGFPIDYSPWGSNLLLVAIGNRLADLVEFLVERGANVDLRGYRPSTTAREAATEMHQQAPDDPVVQRIFRACCGS
jgi:hypothetical protein